MMIKTAIKRLYNYYDLAKKQKVISKPLSWALYQTWKWADTYEKPRETKKDTEM